MGLGEEGEILDRGEGGKVRGGGEINVIMNIC